MVGCGRIAASPAAGSAPVHRAAQRLQALGRLLRPSLGQGSRVGGGGAAWCEAALGRGWARGHARGAASTGTLLQPFPHLVAVVRLAGACAGGMRALEHRWAARQACGAARRADSRERPRSAPPGGGRPPPPAHWSRRPAARAAPSWTAWQTGCAKRMPRREGRDTRQDMESWRELIAAAGRAMDACSWLAD